MLKIGITGGIGSGKSTVCQIFKQLGIPVYDADTEAKRLMTEDSILKQQLVNNFGDQCFDKSGKLNRAYIAQLVFNDAALLSKLNSLVHPAVTRDFIRWSKEQKTPYVIKEAALIFESESFRDLDYVITVSAPKSLRIERTMHRDGSNKSEVIARMKKQWSEQQRNTAADFIIKNDSKKALIPQVMELHEKFLFAANR